MTDKLMEKTISTEPVFKGKVISLQVDTVELPDGSTATREIVKHPGAVAVLAFHNERLLMVDQFRQAMGRCELEIPAGKLEKGEEPMEAAARELQEETGYRCERMTHLHSFYTAPGFSDEIIHLYLAEELTSGEMSPDEDEFLEVYEVSFEEAQQYLAEGRIADAKTMVAFYIWQQRRLTQQAGK
ncbi:MULTISPECIES: NUDIX domain-containing protein [unclassified Paenibacillus]|uniref:NUDIX domain-containing protein n=1 Tax=unclassified Paenibacillus TaxID=185978 RepID=UPI000B11B3E7|nr:MULTISPECIES: NUDIX hydrolase [unclassified Paenibacillus]